MWLATWSWALYSVLLRRRPAELDAITVLCGTMLAALLFLFPLYLWEHAAGSRIPVDLVSVAVIGYVSCAAGIGGFLLFNQGVARVGPVVSNLFLNLIPVFALILAVLLLGERLAWLQAVGAALVMASVAAGARDVPRERPTRAELVST
jgi:drug/metabolite transporter (DMT)-like permease